MNTNTRCCGRCDGVNDLCVADMDCEAHQVQGCEVCFGKRSPSKSQRTGAERIAIERNEQINKHGWKEQDAEYVNNELVHAALYSLAPALNDLFWPVGWQNHFKQKIFNKSRVDRLTVAGAFLAAEIDRLLAIENNQPTIKTD